MGQIDNELQEGACAVETEVCVCVCTVNIEQSLLWDGTETGGDVFSFPGGSFHILFQPPSRQDRPLTADKWEV